MAGKKTDFSKFNPALSIISRSLEDETQDAKTQAALAVAEAPENDAEAQEKKNEVKEEKNNSIEKEFDELDAGEPDEKSAKKKRAQAEALRSFSFKLNREDYTLMRFVCGLNGVSMNEYIVKLIRADMKNYEKYIGAVKEINPELFD